PGQFSETWLYAPDRSAEGALAAFRAGSFFAVHGHIARQVELLVEADGLSRPAGMGEVIQLPPGSPVTATLRLEIPKQDWDGGDNRIDRIELVTIGKGGARIAAQGPLDPQTGSFSCELDVPDDGVVIRARGRRISESG